MAEFATLVDDVRGKIQLDESLYSIEEVRRQVELAHHLYFGSVPIESLTEQEGVLVVLKTWADICRIMATRYALHFPIRTQNGETDEGKVVDNYLKIADRIDNEVSSLEEELGIDETFVVKGSKLLKRDTYRGREVFSNLQVSPPEDAMLPATNLTVTSNVSGTASLSWSPSKSTHFTQYQVWASTTPGIFSKEYLSNSMNPGIRPGSIMSYSTYVNHRTGATVKVPSAGTWYFIVLVRTNFGAVIPSEEVGVAIG